MLIRGDRVEKNTNVDMEPEEAKRFGDDLLPLEAEPVEEPESTPEKPLAEMNHEELKAKAEKLGLSKSGTKADLQERITLHLEGEEELQDNNN